MLMCPLFRNPGYTILLQIMWTVLNNITETQQCHDYNIKMTVDNVRPPLSDF